MSKRFGTTTTKSVDVDVEIDMDDVKDFISSCDEDELEEIRSYIGDCTDNKVTTLEATTIYEESKVEILKEIGNRFNLYELENLFDEIKNRKR